MFDFSRLILKYSVPFQLVSVGGGHYEAGIYLPDEVAPIEMCGAIIPLKERKIYQSGGSLTTKDRQLYCQGSINNALKGAKVIYKGDTYSIEADTDYSDYADVSVYLLKWVSSLDKH